MFKPARWWSEKNRIKVVFKLQFHASQVAEVGGDGLMISVVPGDTGKPSVKSDKAAVRDGSCLWENPVHETVKFNRDPKSGKLHQRMYYFVVGTGSSKPGVVGEASIDFSSYAEATKVSLVSLPLKNSKSEAILHVSIQRVHESMDQREIRENESPNLHSEDHSLSSQVEDHDVDGSITKNSVVAPPPSKALRVSSGSDITLSSSGSSSGFETHWETQLKNESPTTLAPKSDTPSPVHKEHRRSWEWLRDSGLEDRLNDTKINPVETFPVEHSEEAPDTVIGKLKADVAALSRQADMSELELQTLRKQVVKESKRAQDFWREVVSLKEERDGLKRDCEQLKALKRSNEGKTKTNSLFDEVDSQAIVEELRQELNHANELNTNLRIQLQKTQESNSELILAVRDLEEMMEQKNGEMPIPLSRSLEMDIDGKSREGVIACQPDNDDDDDEEQKALDDIVKERSEAQGSRLLEQEIADLQTEIEIYKRDKDELEMQMEQLALDYEIIKQANHDMACKLEQNQIHEQLKMQYECSSSDTAEDELGSRIESLENELQGRTKEYEGSLVTISELQSHVKSLEKELEKQAQGFEVDVTALTRSKVEQEQRAIRAEETLKKMRWRNANAAERLQDEFRKLSVQMASTFEANENLATKALSEANELRLQKSHLEEMLRKISEEHQLVEGHYEARLREVNIQITMMMNQIEQLQSNIEDSAVRLKRQNNHAEETKRLLSDEILMLKEEVKEHVSKNKILSEDLRSKEAVMHELEKMKVSVKEMELLMEQGKDEKIELESRVVLMKREAEELGEELNKLRFLVKEKELEAANLQSELESLQVRCTELQHLLSVDELEKENLKKQVLQLRSDLKKKEDGLKSTEKKTRDGKGRTGTLDAVKATSKTSKPSPRGSKEVANLKERIKLLEGEIKVKDTALEKSANAILEKEEVLHKKIEELEGRLEFKQSRVQFCENKVAQPAPGMEGQACNGRLSNEGGNIDENSSTTSTTSSSVNCGAFLSGKSNDVKDDEMRNEMASLMERNESMERELKEMQERYSDMSLRFAEVEGERQELVMKLRNLTNAKYTSHSTNLFAHLHAKDDP